ncbi:MAG: bacterial proteasome activator family protein, partial [Arthrobacter sp.]|nr:bacterial proteasome activator family protein [Arthrobacter sp.]
QLVSELERIHLPFPESTTPSDGELRIAQAQLVGWLEGLFHGIQTAIAAQHASREQSLAQQQLRQLPPGTVIAPGVVIGANGEPQRAVMPQPGAAPSQPPVPPADPDHGPGQYL